MNAHTPGPWNMFVGNANGRGLIRIEVDGTGEHIASLVRSEQAKANARLIAAAPELADALRELCADKYLADPINNDRMAKARAVLAKLGE